MATSQTSFSVNLDFEVINFPPVSDILILGKKTSQGKYGVLQSFQLITPDVFELLEISDDFDENVEAVIVNKSILKKLPKEEVLKILKKHIFPFVSKGETIRVNFNIRLFRHDIKGNLDES